MEISTVFGLPAHPLFVHLPVVGIPLMALAVIAYILVPSKPAWLFWMAGAITVVVTIATVLTAGSGEQLESMLSSNDSDSALISQHAELGEQTEIIVVIFAALSLGYLALDWRRRKQVGSDVSSTDSSILSAGRMRSLLLGLGIAAIIAGSVATVWDVRAGHSGAKSNWQDFAVQDDVE